MMWIEPVITKGKVMIANIVEYNHNVETKKKNNERCYTHACAQKSTNILALSFSLLSWYGDLRTWHKNMIHIRHGCTSWHINAFPNIQYPSLQYSLFAREEETQPLCFHYEQRCAMVTIGTEEEIISSSTVWTFIRTRRKFNRGRYCYSFLRAHDNFSLPCLPHAWVEETLSLCHCEKQQYAMAYTDPVKTIQVKI